MSISTVTAATNAPETSIDILQGSRLFGLAAG
jgi:hypothetical protein